MDILTVFKVIALAVVTVAAVFVMLAAATMWRTERVAANRITRLISADPAEASGDKERADRALLDVTEITRRVSEEPAEAEAEAEDGSAEIARLKEEVSFLNECREADSRRIQNLEERLGSLEYCDDCGCDDCDDDCGCDDCDDDCGCDDCDDDDCGCDDCDGAVPVSGVVRTLIVTGEIPSTIARGQSASAFVEAFKQAQRAAEDTPNRKSPAMKSHCEEQEKGDSEANLFERRDTAIRNLVGDTTPNRPSPSKYPLFETEPSSKSWQYRCGQDLDRRMDALREVDNQAVRAARFQVNRVRKMDFISLRALTGVRKAVEEAEKSVKEEN